MQVKTLSLLLTKALEEIFTDWHFVKISVVRQQTFLIAARACNELWTDDDISLIVKLVASSISVSQTLPESPVDWANTVCLISAVPR